MDKSNLVAGGVVGAAVIGAVIWTASGFDLEEQLAKLAPDPYDQAPKAQIEYYSGYSRESPEMQDWEFDPHKEEYLLFYGAIAASGVEYGYWVHDFHDIETARAAALNWCNYDLPADVPRCKIIADIVPGPEVDVENLIAGLSAVGQIDYLSYKREGRSKAFAISPVGAYGWSWGNVTPTSAKTDALQQCELSVADIGDIDGVDSSCFIFDLNGDIQASTQ